MGSIYLGQILADLLEGQRSVAAPDMPLEPIVPGVWAAGAKAAGDEPATRQNNLTPAPKPARRVRAFHLHGADR